MHAKILFRLWRLQRRIFNFDRKMIVSARIVRSPPAVIPRIRRKCRIGKCTQSKRVVKLKLFTSMRKKHIRKTQYLPNYLKRYRLGSGLTQVELGYLLGCRGDEISDYENDNIKTPSRTILLGYEKLFNQTLKHFYPRVAWEIGLLIEKQCRELLQRIAAQPLTASNQARIDFLKGRANNQIYDRDTGTN